MKREWYVRLGVWHHVLQQNPPPLPPPMKILKNKHPSTKEGVPEDGSLSFFNSFYKHPCYKKLAPSHKHQPQRPSLKGA